MDAAVIIVGAGPVGLMLAGELRLGGADVIVVERLTEPTTESRASTLHARTLEILDQRGLLDPLGEPPCEPRGHFGGIPLDLGGVPSRYAGQWKVPQTQTEELLGEWAAGLGADIRRGHQLTGLKAGEDHVEAEVSGPGGATVLRAAYLVGCDGEDSAVRALGGFEFPGRDATKELIRADVDGIEIPNRRFQRLEKGLAIAARRGDGVTRVMVHEFGRAAVSREKPPEFAELAEIWKRVTGEDITSGMPIWVNAFGNTLRQATRYRQDRMLLAGDAAHRQMPIGGQALNLGLQDAVNLGWKLAGQVRGWAPPGLLDSYHDERHAVGARVLANIEAQATLLLGGEEAGPLRRVFGELMEFETVRGHLAAMISGLDVRYGEDEFQPLTGARLPHWDPGSGASTTELLRDGRGLFLDPAPSGGQNQVRTVAAGWSDRVRTVSEAPAAGTAAQAVLVRPDGYVAWASAGGGDEAGALRHALQRWFGAPEGE